jgi:hypothetical protein
MVEKMSMFTPSEIVLGHILPTGVVIDKWLTEGEDKQTVYVFLTAAGMGFGFERTDMVGVLGTVGMSVLATLRDEFSKSYAEATGEQMEFLSDAA